MAYEQKEGSATLFRNDKKSSPNQPDWRGEGKLNGETVEIAAWDKETGKGSPMLSLNIKPKQAYTPKQDKVTSNPNEDDLDIPF